jgi:hypothetical protein
MHFAGRLREVELELGGIDLRRVRRFTLLCLGHAEGSGEGIDEEIRPERDEAAPEVVDRLVRIDRRPHAVVDGTGVETGVEGHQADAGLGVAGEHGALHGCGTAPAREEREVQVHHGDGLEHVRLDELAEGHDDAELDARIDDVVDPVGDGDPAGERRRLHRARDERTSPPPLAVGLGDDDAHLVPGGDERLERGHRGVGRSEEGELQSGSSRLRRAFIAALR